MSLRTRLILMAVRKLQRDEFSLAGARFRAAEGVLNPTAFRSSLLFAREAVRRAPVSGRALELGCGLGLAAVLLGRRGLSATALDRDARAVRATAENARRNGVAVIAVVSDWDTALAPGARFDWIVANPPFLGTEQTVFNHALYAGEGLEVVAACARAISRRLAREGHGLVMTSERSGRARVEAALDCAGLVSRRTLRLRHWGERYLFDIVESAGS